MQLDEPGEYQLQVLLDSELLHEYPITVKKNRLPIVVKLEPQELEFLTKPVMGQGGFQSLLKRVQASIDGELLVLNIPEARRLVQYAQKYGSGGFQGRLARVVNQVEDQLNTAGE
ncbi:MAG: hypothetical protein M3Y56_06515 [Armatimonadota bacterium]|nr:hypothetical protein [Armatimonadota bacterium]